MTNSEKDLERPTESFRPGKSLFVDDSENDIDNKSACEPLSLRSGISKNVDTWGSPRGNSGKAFPHSATQTSASTALTQIYSPPTHTLPTTPQGIVAHALNVASDHRPLNIKEQSSFRKVAKKRRKQNGGVDVEHTKSSKEFLRKAQQALRVAQSESEEEDLAPPTSDAGAIAQPTRGIYVGGSLNKGIIKTMRSKAMDVPEEETSDGSNGTARTQGSTPTVSSTGSQSKGQHSKSQDSSNPLGYEDPDMPETKTSSNPYGYEDPDQAMASAPAQRPRGSARRRCSVTEYSLRAVHQAAAAAAVERMNRLQLTRAHLESAMLKTCVPGSAGGSTPPPHLDANQYGYEKLDASETSNPYGYENADTPLTNNRVIAAPTKVNDHQGLRMPVRTEGPPVANAVESMGPPSRLTGSLYGYEETIVPLDTSSKSHQPPRRRRAQRRGSVTKYSLQAAQNVAQMAKDDDEKDSAMAIDEPETENALSPTATAPTMPTRKKSPWQSSRLAALARTAEGPPVIQAPSVYGERSRARGRSGSGDLLSESFRSNYSGDALSVSFRTNHSTEFLSDSSDEGSSSSESESDDESFGESIESITIPLKGESSSDRVMRPPSRHDSFRSFTSRGSTCHSIESDGDSLAPDMQSLCSISFREQGPQGPNPPIPTYLPRTPTSMKSRKAPVHTTSGSSLEGLNLDAVRASRLGEPRGTSLSFRERHRVGRERYLDHMPSGSIPPVALAGLGGDASPLPSPKVKPFRTCSRTTSGSGKSLHAASYLRNS